MSTVVSKQKWDALVKDIDQRAKYYASLKPRGRDKPPTPQSLAIAKELLAILNRHTGKPGK